MKWKRNEPNHQATDEGVRYVWHVWLTAKLFGAAKLNNLFSRFFAAYHNVYIFLSIHKHNHIHITAINYIMQQYLQRKDVWLPNIFLPSTRSIMSSDSSLVYQIFRCYSLKYGWQRYLTVPHDNVSQAIAAQGKLKCLRYLPLKQRKNEKITKLPYLFLFQTSPRSSALLGEVWLHS